MAEAVDNTEQARRVWTGARAGEARAREELAVRARSVAGAELRRRGLAGHDVDELAQEAVVSVLRYLDQRPEPPRDLRAFLKYRALGVLGDWRKRMRVRGDVQPLDEHTDPAGPVAEPARRLERADLSAALAECLGRLPAAQREVVLLRYRTGQASRGIASRLSIDKSTVNVRTFRALRALRECLARRGHRAEDLS